MKQVNIHEAKTHLSALLEDVRQGEKLVIAKAGKPVAMVVPYSETQLPRFGFMKGMFDVPDDFDTMFQMEIEEMFYGKDAVFEGEGE
jgi:prevent-host-death family protein